MRVTVTAVPDPNDPNGLDAVVSTIRCAADAGFSRLWFPQPPPWAEVAGWDALTTLAVAGAATPGIELGSSVVVAYTQHPFALARQALTASAATGGRLILGIGVSHRFLVADMLGYDYSAPAAFLREYLQVLGPALAGQPVDHHGPRITAVGQLTVPKAPSPPVIAAALGPRMLDLAGELTDGTVTTWTGPKTVEQQIIPRITRAAAAAGRPAPQVIVGLPVSVTSDVQAARNHIAATFSHQPGDMPAYRAMMDLEGVDSIADMCVFGDEADVVAQLRRFADIGATEFTAIPLGDNATQARTVEVLAANREIT
jgi:F420-dependent oxidoreductase-like protein